MSLPHFRDVGIKAHPQVPKPMVSLLYQWLIICLGHGAAVGAMCVVWGHKNRLGWLPRSLSALHGTTWVLGGKGTVTSAW